MCLRQPTPDDKQRNERGTCHEKLKPALLGAAAALLLLGAHAQAQDDKIMIGGAMSLTGVQAPLDTPALKGAEVAVKYLNDNGGLLGKQVELVNIDGKSDPVTVGNVAVELIDKGADLIMAPCDFDFGGPASREAQSAGLVKSPARRSALFVMVWATSSSPFPCGFPYRSGRRGPRLQEKVENRICRDRPVHRYTKSLSNSSPSSRRTVARLSLRTLHERRQQFLGNSPACNARHKAGRDLLSSYGQDIETYPRAARSNYDAPVMGGDV